MKTVKKVHDSFSWLYQKRITEAKSLEEMATLAGCSVATIRRRLQAKGLK